MGGDLRIVKELGKVYKSTTNDHLEKGESGIGEEKKKRWCHERKKSKKGGKGKEKTKRREPSPKSKKKRRTRNHKTRPVGPRTGGKGIEKRGGD